MNRARVACTAACAGGFFTLPLYPLTIVVGWFAGGERQPGEAAALGLGWLSGTVMWASAVGVALGLLGFALGWLHRRAIEVGGATPDDDAALARAGELLGAGVTVLALFLLFGTVMHEANRAPNPAVPAGSAPPSGADQPK